MTKADLPNFHTSNQSPITRQCEMFSLQRRLISSQRLVVHCFLFPVNRLEIGRWDRKRDRPLVQLIQVGRRRRFKWANQRTPAKVKTYDGGRGLLHAHSEKVRGDRSEPSHNKSRMSLLTCSACADRDHSDPYPVDEAAKQSRKQEIKILFLPAVSSHITRVCVSIFNLSSASCVK